MLQAQYWEGHLLDMAHAALDSGVSGHAHATADQRMLDSAYAQCENITRENSKTFFMAASLLPGSKRRATQALYAFCRLSDDLVDKPSPSEKDHLSRLDAWKQHVIYGCPVADDPSAGGVHPAGRPVSLAWADARRTHAIPRGYVEQLIDGLALDLQHTRYETFGDLAQYCYGAACTVGLMSMHIVGYAGREAIPYAIRLGVALQLTNILRDVGEDWRTGRLYLPLEELHQFGLSERDIEAGRVDQRWRAFMRFQIDRTHRLYEEALPGVSMLHKDGRFAIAAAGELYRAILTQIEVNDYDVFTRRASVSAVGKLRRLPGIWWRANTVRA